MANNKWVEVEAKSIDDAIKAGLNELNLEDSTQADIKILREPEGGVFGVGGTKALVRISVRGGQGRSYSNNNRRNNNRRNNNNNNKKPNNTRKPAPRQPRVEADKNEQLKVSTEFLDGLIKSFGLDGSVEGEIEDENLVVKVKGEQTEALVGDKGFIIDHYMNLQEQLYKEKLVQAQDYV
jgi:predicted RNA-binding protein Jag